ncbi:MAG TPA: ABC transporter permease [Bacteroidetes bacterium]|nr:ABC transporter permease [Bacteroidota bacterium]
MFRFFLRRFFYGFLVMWGVVSLIFILFNILPADPARMMLGQRSDVATLEAINKDLGRDRPVFIQYLNYLNDLSPLSYYEKNDEESHWYFDKAKYAGAKSLLQWGENKQIVLKKPYMRRSYQSGKNVSSIIAEAFPNTAVLALSAISIAILIGMTIGFFAAKYKDSLFDRSVLLFSVFGMSVPSFFAAVIIAWVFAFLLGDYTGLNMYGSMYEVDDLGRGEYLNLRNLILPAITLGIRPLAIVVELSRNALLEVNSMDYMRTARSKGLSENKVLWKHGMRNALNPVITAVTAWFASLLAGAVFVEYVFDWKGLGVIIVNGLETFDFPVVMGIVLFISVLLISINIFVDVIYAWIDPRVRLQK